MRKIIFLSVFVITIALTSCIKEENALCEKNVTITLSTPEFGVLNNPSSRLTRATEDPATAEEKAIKNLYLFFFKEDGSLENNSLKYYIDGAAFSGGKWDEALKKITVDKRQGDLGKRQVYVMANCNGIKTNLDGVNSLNDLKNVLKTTSSPWTIGNDIATNGLLMEGHSAHDFSADYQLKTIQLIRAVAKLQITATLDITHQSPAAADYGYKYLNFGTETWAFEKADQQTSDKTGSHTGWQNIPGITNGTAPTTISLSTYINEYANTGEPTAMVELKLPYKSGPLPPPEFGDGDVYRLKLPLTVKRNTVYKYNIDIK